MLEFRRQEPGQLSTTAAWTLGPDSMNSMPPPWITRSSESAPGTRAMRIGSRAVRGFTKIYAWITTRWSMPRSIWPSWSIGRASRLAANCVRSRLYEATDRDGAALSHPVSKGSFAALDVAARAASGSSKSRAKMVVVETTSEGATPVGKSIIYLSSVTTVGLDLAKYVFQVHCVDTSGCVVCRQSDQAQQAAGVPCFAAALPGGA